VDQKYYLWQEEEDGLVPSVSDSLDNYKILSERMNVLTIYLPCRKFGNVLTSPEPESAVLFIIIYFFFTLTNILVFIFNKLKWKSEKILRGKWNMKLY